MRCISISTSIRRAPRGKIQEFGSYPIIPTISGGLAQIQQRLMEALDKINNLPINPLLEQATTTLAQSENDAARSDHAG